MNIRKSNIAVIVVFAMVLAGCASVSDRVNIHSLGEIQVSFASQDKTKFSQADADQFTKALTSELEKYLSAQLKGEQPLHIYLHVQEAGIVTGKRAAVLALFSVLTASATNTIVTPLNWATITVVRVPGQSGVAAPDIQDILRALAEDESMSRIELEPRYKKSVGKRSKKISGLAKNTAALTKNWVTRE